MKPIKPPTRQLQVKDFHDLPESSKTREWFTPDNLYAQTQPFRTLTKSNYDFVVKHLTEFVKEPRETTALEIGPGSRPVSPALKFKKILFLDRSPEIAKKMPNQNIAVEVTKENFDLFTKAEPQLERLTKFPGVKIYRGITVSKIANEKSKTVVGDIRSLPIKPEAKFGVVIVNEVLTHVEPSKRVKTVENLADHSDALYLIDRPQLKINEYLERARFLANIQLELLKGQTTPQANELRKKALQQTKWGKYVGRQIQSRLVHFPSIISALKRKGFMVETVETTQGTTKYVILKAKRVSKK